jgi:hypothetical protein
MAKAKPRPTNRSGCPNQIALFGALAKELKRQGFPNANQRQINSLIAAADLIVKEYGRPHEPAVPLSGLTLWLKSDDTGSSSREMARHLAPLAGLPDYVDARGDLDDNDQRIPNTPIDPSDLGRCIGLLDAVPEFRPLLPRMAEVSPLWAAFIEAWTELEGLYREELLSGSVPKCYERMQEIRKAFDG